MKKTSSSLMEGIEKGDSARKSRRFIHVLEQSTRDHAGCNSVEYLQECLRAGYVCDG